MQPVSADFLRAILGSHTLQVRLDAWYDGDLVASDIPISGDAHIDLDADRTVQGQVTSLRVVDPDGKYEPRSETAPLAPYGSRLHVTAWIDGLADVLSLGWYRITQSATKSRWGWYDIPRPATVTSATATFSVYWDCEKKTTWAATGGASGSSLVDNNLDSFQSTAMGYITDDVLVTKTSSTTATNAVSNNRYFTFTVNPPSGVTTWTPKNITFKIARGGSSTPRGVAIRTSDDSYAANVYSADATSVKPTMTTISQSLTGLGTTTGPLTFRFYPYSTSTSATVDFDDITVTGSYTTTVAVESTQADRVWVRRGGDVLVDADDLMWQVDAERFLAPESPAGSATCIGEIGRLLSGIMPIGSTAGVTDRGVPSSVVYNDSRADAVKSLADALNADIRVSPHGLLDLVPKTTGASVWTIDVAPGRGYPGALVDANTVLSAEDLPNAARSTGSDPTTNLPIVGMAFEGGNALKYGQMTEGGSLRFGGPHGRIPVFHDSPLITTQSQANADALTVLQTAQSKRAQTLNVTCVPNPAIQLLDYVTLRTPAGDLVGQVRQVSIPLNGGAMTMKVLVPRANYLALWSRL